MAIEFTLSEKENVYRIGKNDGYHSSLALVSEDATQTLTNKTLTSPAVTGLTGTLASPTLTTPTLTTPTLTNPNIQGFQVVNSTSETFAFTAASYANRPIVLNRAAGMTITLPAATGTGNKYTVIVGATFTGAATISAASGTDYFIGTAVLFADGGDTAVAFATANTGTVATESDRLSLFGTANSQGGFKGAIAEFWDIGSAVWAVRYVSDAGGTEASPFSASV